MRSLMEKELRELSWLGSEQDLCILGWAWSSWSSSMRMLPGEACGREVGEGKEG